MSATLDEQIEQLKGTIAEMEARSAILGEATVEAALVPLYQKLVELEAKGETSFEEPVGVPTRQRKLVTLLFMDIVGSTQMTQHLDPEDTLEIMDDALRKLAVPVDSHGGHVTRFMGDGFKAVFGDPIAREDDPEQAIRAGLDILEAAKSLAQELETEWEIDGFKVRIGINTGLAALGGYTEAEDTVMGLPVNLAARIESAAPSGGLLISHNTYRHVRGVFDVQPQESIDAKGFTEPVQVYLVQRARPRAFRVPMLGVEGVETRMVGRQAELKQLHDAMLTAIEDGEGGVVTISGDAGVGKSRLLYEFQNWIELLPPPPVRLFVGRSRQESQGQPYSLLRDLFTFRFQILDDNSIEEARRKLEAGFGEVIGEQGDGLMRAHIIGQLLGFDFSTSPHLKDVLNDPEQLRNRGLMYLGEYFQEVSHENPIIMFLEDIHWADESSLDAVNRLGERATQQRILIVCAARPTLFERRPNWIKEQTYHTHLEIHPLNKRESTHLLVEILKLVDEIPAEMHELVISRAEGNPFYMEEMIKMLIEDGVVIIGEDIWRVEKDQFTQVNVPSTLAGVLQARLDSLPSHERLVLQQASVVGRLFWDRLVEHIQAKGSDGSNSQFVSIALSSLSGRELIYRREESSFIGSVEYLFKHDVLREVTYESVLKRLRKIYHGLVADWLIANSGERLGEYFGSIADHLELAEKFENAQSYLCQAGEFAAIRYSNSEAEAYFSRALKVTNNIEPETDTTNYQLTAHIALGDLLTLTGRFDEALDQFYLAQAIIDCKDFSGEQLYDLAELYRKIAEVFERQSEYETALEWLNKGLNYLERGELSIEAAYIYLLGAGIYHRLGKNDDALDWCRKSTAISSQIETPEAKRSLAQAYYLEGAVQCRLGNLRKSVDLSKESLQIYLQIDDVLGQARAYNNISIAYMDLGEWDQARENLQKSLEINQRIGDLFNQGNVINNLACIHLDRGEWDQAKQLFSESNQIWKRIGASLPNAVTLSNLAQVYLYQENWSNAGKTLQESEEIFAETGSVDFLAELERRWGEYYLGIGDSVEALSHTQRSIELAEEQKAPLDRGITLRVLGEINTQLENFDQAEQALERSFNTLQELSSEYEAAKTILAITRLALERGMHADRDQIGHAIQIFEKVGAQADLLYARSLAKRLS